MKLEAILPADRKPRLHRWQTIGGSVLAAGLAAVPACAGPPCVSDDPEPTEYMPNRRQTIFYFALKLDI